METTLSTEKLDRIFGELGDMKLQRFFQDDGDKIGNFRQAIVKADDINARSNHFTTKARALSVGYDDDKFFLKDADFDKEIQFSSFGLSKMCSVIGVPAEYIKKCISIDNKKLAAENMNNWIKQALPEDKDLLIRTTDNRLYSVLTTKYGIFDDHEVLGITDDILSESKQYKVVNSLVRPEYMKIRIVSRDTIKVGDDDLQFGFDIKNSRVGSGSLELNLLMYRIICANGCLVGGAQGTLYRQRHVGIKPHQFEENFRLMLKESPRIFEDTSTRIEKNMSETLTKESFQQWLDRFAAQNFATKNMLEQVKENYESEGMNTAWGFVNSLTSVAQGYNYDAREDLERFAGNILAR